MSIDHVIELTISDVNVQNSIGDYAELTSIIRPDREGDSSTVSALVQHAL
jgi:hypothetical protein